MSLISETQIALFNQNLRFEDPLEIIEFAVGLADNPLLTTSFGPHSAVLLHAVTRTKPEIQVVWCDSGYNTAATYDHAVSLIELLNLNIRIFAPEYTTAYLNSTIGVPSIENPKHSLFSELVKLEPFKRAMDVFKPDLWFTNVRKGQTVHRDNLDILSLTSDGILKVSPFYHYSDTEIKTYLIENGLPAEYDYFDPVKALEHRECGIHLKN